MKKEIKFVWSVQCEKPFRGVKVILHNTPNLSAPDFNVPFKLAVDVTARAVLLQKGKDGIDHLVGHFSRTFNQNQTITQLLRNIV